MDFLTILSSDWMSLRRALVELCEGRGSASGRLGADRPAHQIILGDGQIRVETSPLRHEVFLGVRARLVLVDLAELGTELGLLATKACGGGEISELERARKQEKHTLNLAVLKVTAARLSRVASGDQSASVNDGSLEGDGWKR
jgi:hypothetical protein